MPLRNSFSCEKNSHRTKKLQAVEYNYNRVMHANTEEKTNSPTMREYYQGLQNRNYMAKNLQDVSMWHLVERERGTSGRVIVYTKSWKHGKVGNCEKLSISEM